MRIAVGSTSVPKLNAARWGFGTAWPDLTIAVTGHKVDSGVRDQPQSADETIRGAQNRARAVALLVPDADYAVGMEGGLLRQADQDFEGGWIVVRDRTGDTGTAATPLFQVPLALSRYLHNGLDLNQAMEAVTGIPEIGNEGGFFGYQTDGVLTRDMAYGYAVLVALARFKYPEMWT